MCSEKIEFVSVQINCDLDLSFSFLRFPFGYTELSATVTLILEKRFSSKASLPLRVPLAMAGDILGCCVLGGVGRVTVMVSRPEMLLNLL